MIHHQQLGENDIVVSNPARELISGLMMIMMLYGWSELGMAPLIIRQTIICYSGLFIISKRCFPMLENGNTVVIDFLDFAKAFVSVSHRFLFFIGIDIAKAN